MSTSSHQSTDAICEPDSTREPTSVVALSRAIGDVTLAPDFRGPTYGWVAGARWAVPMATLGVGYALALQGHPTVLFVAGLVSGAWVAACELSLSRRRLAVQRSAEALYRYARSRLGEEHELTVRAKTAAQKAETIKDGQMATQLEEGLSYTWELLQQPPATS